MFHYSVDTSPHLSASGIGCEIQGELRVQAIYAESLYLQNLRLDSLSVNSYGRWKGPSITEAT